MDEKIAYWGSVVFSALALVLMIANVSYANINRTLQMDVAQRQSTLNAAQQFAQLNQGLVQAMAEAAFKNNDLQLRDLLASQGITLKAEPTAKTAEKSADKAPDQKPTAKK